MMTFDYFYGNQSDLFAFYRVAKRLFTAHGSTICPRRVKPLYGIQLDRMSLFAKNG